MAMGMSRTQKIWGDSETQTRRFQALDMWPSTCYAMAATQSSRFGIIRKQCNYTNREPCNRGSGRTALPVDRLSKKRICIGIVIAKSHIVLGCGVIVRFVCGCSI